MPSPIGNIRQGLQWKKARGRGYLEVIQPKDFHKRTGIYLFSNEEGTLAVARIGYKEISGTDGKTMFAIEKDGIVYKFEHFADLEEALGIGTLSQYFGPIADQRKWT